METKQMAGRRVPQTNEIGAQMAIIVDILICEPTEARHLTAFVVGAELVSTVMPAGLLMRDSSSFGE